jgi:hypothetical protein
MGGQFQNSRRLIRFSEEYQEQKNPGFDLSRKIWCKLNRFRTGHGKCNNIMLFHWNIRENPSCECGAEKETIQHIVEECALIKFQQGFSRLHLLTEDALNWLQQIKNIIYHNYFVNFEF